MARRHVRPAGRCRPSRRVARLREPGLPARARVRRPVPSRGLGCDGERVGLGCPPMPHRSRTLSVPALRTTSCNASSGVRQRCSGRVGPSSSAGSITSSCRRAARCRRDGPGNGCRPADHRIEPTPHGCSLRAWCGDHVGVRRLRRRERGPAYRAGPRRARFPRRRDGHPRLPRGHVRVSGRRHHHRPGVLRARRSGRMGLSTSASTARSRSGRSRFSARSSPATRQSPSCWPSSSSARGCPQPRRQR